MAAAAQKGRGWQKRTVSGTEVLVTGTQSAGDSGRELGFYYAFMIGRRYVSIMSIGPEANKAEPARSPQS